MTTIFIILLAITFAISATILAVLVSFLRQHKRSEAMYSVFDGISDEFSLVITKQQPFGNRMIGLDERTGKVLFLEIVGMEQNGYLVDLESVKYFGVRKVYDKGTGGRRQNLPDKVLLEVEYKWGERSLQLPFFIKAMDPVAEVGVRVKYADEWQLLLSSLLHKMDSNKRIDAVAGNMPEDLIRPGSLIRAQYTAGQLN